MSAVMIWVIWFPFIPCQSFSKEINLGLNVSQRAMMLEISHDLTTWIKRCGQFIKITRNTTGQMDHFGIISKTILLWSSVQHRYFYELIKIIAKRSSFCFQQFFNSSQKFVFINSKPIWKKNQFTWSRPKSRYC